MGKASCNIYRDIIRIINFICIMSLVLMYAFFNSPLLYNLNHFSFLSFASHYRIGDLGLVPAAGSSSSSFFQAQHSPDTLVQKEVYSSTFLNVETYQLRT